MTKQLRIVILLCAFAVPWLSAGPALSQDEVIGPAAAEPPKDVETGITTPAPEPAPEPATEQREPVHATLSAEDKQALDESVKEMAAQVARQAVSEMLAQQKAAEAAKAQTFEVKGNFMDTRITWVFGDDDFLADAGEKIPDSPLLSIGDREGYELFMDNIDSRYTGRENLTHLVMYKKMPGFFPKLTTEAALVLKFQLSESSVDMTDDGTYIRIHYHTAGEQSDDGLSFVLFPFDTERFRLGYLWDISWGGGAIFTNKRNGWAPGLKMALKIKRFNMFVGFKTA